MVTALAVTITVGLAACGSSRAVSNQRSSVTVPAATNPVDTQPAVAAAAPLSTLPGTNVASGSAAVSDADVADMEKQLDEIDQLLAGVDSDLSHD